LRVVVGWRGGNKVTARTLFHAHNLHKTRGNLQGVRWSAKCSRSHDGAISGVQVTTSHSSPVHNNRQLTVPLSLAALRHGQPQTTRKGRSNDWRGNTGTWHSHPPPITLPIRVGRSNLRYIFAVATRTREGFLPPVKKSPGHGAVVGVLSVGSDFGTGNVVTTVVLPVRQVASVA
jgi:hypothetical protein